MFSNTHCTTALVYYDALLLLADVMVSKYTCGLHTFAKDDIKAYIGIWIIMAINPKPCAEDYWSTDPALPNAYISKTMPRNRFFQHSEVLSCQ